MKSKKEKVIKTRGGGKYTESQFWSLIRSALRQKSRWWNPIQKVKQSNRRKSQSSNKRLKFEYLCAICKNWFPDKEVNVDHIIPAGSLTCSADLPSFVERLFCEEDGLRVLCKKCHQEVTNLQRENK
ncbi:MAG TPA: HNH endonuclease signature motif containing protein [Nitrososphaeraceae archaeon]|jgi:HNH endonuclease.